ncbi:MAG: hypothetical protein O2810_07330 [Bacteroidetes bacterium]|nr:hypothetical protein [Bacteroidota bacterium]
MFLLKMVVIQTTAHHLSYYNINMDYMVEEGAFSIYVGNSSDKKDLKHTQINLTQNIYFNEK